MSRVPDFFGLGSDISIPTYDYFDIASGTGYVKLYGGTGSDASVSGSAIFSNITFYSEDIYLQANTTTALAAPSKIIDKDFDVLMNRPLTIKGLAIVNLCTKIGGVGSEIIWYPWVRLRKWDGTTETEIVNTSGSTCKALSDADVYKAYAIKLNVPETTIKKGEYLRMTIEGYAGCGATDVLYIGCDPMNRTTGWSTDYFSSLIIQLPTEIEG